MNIESIRRRVYRIDAMAKVLNLASLQIDRDDLADVCQMLQEVNWEVHDLIEELEPPKGQVFDLSVVNKNN